MCRVQSPASLYQTATGSSPLSSSKAPYSSPLSSSKAPNSSCSSPGGSYTTYQTPAEKVIVKVKVFISALGHNNSNTMFKIPVE